jgi:hypothetical protein
MRTVSCLDCGAVIERGDPPDPLNPQPCPNCGSARRSVALGAITMVGTSTLSIGASITAAGKVSPAPKTTAIGPATHVCEVWITPPSDDLAYHFVEVVRGDEVIAQGMGDDLVDALLGVIEYLLPPGHEEYPGPVG